MQKTTAQHPGIQDLKWSCSISCTSTWMLVNNPTPRHHHIMSCGAAAIGSKTTAGSSSRTSQEAWLVAHASLLDYHHSWYIFSCPPHPTPSYAASYHLVRKCVIDLSRGSLWGEALQYYEDRKSLSLGLLRKHKHAPTHMQRTTLKTLCKKMLISRDISR